MTALKLRLSDAGLDLTLDYCPGGHHTPDKVSELIEHLKTATVA